VARLGKEYDKIAERGKNMVDPKTDKDSPLWADAKDWDAADKRHNQGIYRLHFAPTKAYKDRYDLIDWNA
jgi:hypothetical protein